MTTLALNTTRATVDLERPETFGTLQEFLTHIINGEWGRRRAALATSDTKAFGGFLEAERALQLLLLQPRDPHAPLPPDAAPFCNAVIEALEGAGRSPTLTERMSASVHSVLLRMVG